LVAVFDLPTTIPNQSCKVLAIVPHPDDETLGCGGLIAMLARQQSQFYFVFVTDGGASHPPSVAWPSRRLARRRKAEAIEALHRLGVGDASRRFLKLADAAMPEPHSVEWNAAVSELVDIVKKFQPDLALLPWRRDPHCDHRNSWQLAQTAFQRACTRPVVLEYAIWLDEFGTPEDQPRPEEALRVVYDVSSVLAAKQAAIAAHVSQTTSLIDDDPIGFRLTPETLARLVRPTETFWWARDATD
jgi:LmbE family N-acetylglucosaminyl deacetylase